MGFPSLNAAVWLKNFWFDYTPPTISRMAVLTADRADYSVPGNGYGMLGGRGAGIPIGGGLRGNGMGRGVGTSGLPPPTTSCSFCSSMMLIIHVLQFFRLAFECIRTLASRWQ
jgi:hypothetical protein